LNLVGNLCCENDLRKMIVADMGGLLSQVVAGFKKDGVEKKFDWLGNVTREFNVFINSCQDNTGKVFLQEKGIVEDCSGLLSMLVPNG
jgi:hypothetical protein